MKKAKDAARDVIALLAPDATLEEGQTAEDQAKGLVNAYLRDLVQELGEALGAARGAGVGTGKAAVALVRGSEERWKGFAHRLEQLPEAVIGTDLKGRFKTEASKTIGTELAAVAWATPKSAAQIAAEKAKAQADRKGNKRHGRGKGRRDDHRGPRAATAKA
jgi:hypothetical protein